MKRSLQSGPRTFLCGPAQYGGFRHPFYLNPRKQVSQPSDILNYYGNKVLAAALDPLSSSHLCLSLNPFLHNILGLSDLLLASHILQGQYKDQVPWKQVW